MIEQTLLFFYKYRSKALSFAAVLFLNYSLSDIAVQVADYYLQSEPPSMQLRRAPTARKPDQLSHQELKNAILGGPLFSGARDPESDNSAVEKPSGPQVSEEFSKLGLELTGTVTGPDWFSRAYIKVKNSKDPGLQEGRAYKIGAMVQDSKVLWIGRDKVLLFYNGAREWLYLYPVEKKPAEKKSVFGSGAAVKRVMSRGDLNKQVFNNLNNIMKGIAVGPNFVGGKMDGYLIRKIKPNNVLYSLGARSGDIVKAVNGHAIDDIKKVLKLWEGMREERQIRVDLLRGGKIVTYDFEIRN